MTKHRTLIRNRNKNIMLNSWAYKWAIDSDRPHSWAKQLAHAINYGMQHEDLERLMGNKLTFTKCKVRVRQVTDSAFRADVRIDSGLNIWTNDVWIPRSNIRSDDDKRMTEFKQQFDSGQGHINTFVFVADWYVAQKKWKAQEA